MPTVEWKIHLQSKPEIVFDFLTQSSGREKFWAESAEEKNGIIHFIFPNGVEYRSRVQFVKKNREFHLDYFNSLLKIKLEPTANNETDLILNNEDVEQEEFMEVYAGWVSVLLNLKAAVDLNCDLRNHDENRTWSQKFVDN